MPEPHLVGIGTSLALQQAHGWRVFRGTGLRRGGAVLIGTGVVVAGWATLSAGRTELARSEALVTGGPYAFSRHPMYVGWTLMYLGYGLLTDSAWPLVIFPGIAGWMHRTILGEERRLEERFGSSYRDYASRVPRYLGTPRLDST